MINFWRSTFTWKSHPWMPDPYYRWAGGFVGETGQVYHVRFNLQGMCRIDDPDSGVEWECFLGAPCRTEYTIAESNMFQVPSGEFRMAFSRDAAVPVSYRSRTPEPSGKNGRLSDLFRHHHIDIREFQTPAHLTDVPSIVAASLQNKLLNAICSWVDETTGLTVSVEFPVNLINLNEADAEFQICTGPVVLPDLSTWDGKEAHRVYLAHVALSSFDHVEFILSHEVEASAAERAWLDQPQGRDRLELRDAANQPPGYPPGRPNVRAYHDVWEMASENTVWAVDE